MDSEKVELKAEKMLIDGIRSTIDKDIASSGDDVSFIDSDSAKTQIDASKALTQRDRVIPPRVLNY